MNKRKEKYPSISLLLPTKNHEKIIIENISKLENFLRENFYDFEILVLSNGSNMHNLDIIKNAKFFNNKILFYEIEKPGKGNAVKFGLKNSSHDNIVIFDADFSYDYNLILKFFENLVPKSAFCYANRNSTKGIFQNTKISRLIAGNIFNKLIRIYLGINARDTQAGFKLINKNTFTNSFEFTSENYMYDVELFLLAKKLKITPVPIEINEIKTPSTSNVKLFRDSLVMLFSLRKIKKQYFN